MSDTRQLSAQDPVSQETLKKFEDLDGARYELGLKLLQLEQDRVRVLAAAHQVDQQRQRLFEQLLVERGLDPATPVSISELGEIKVLERQQQAAPAP